MPRFVDPDQPRRKYETPIQRFGCPLERDALSKRGLAAQLRNFSMVEGRRYSCPAPPRNSRISLFSVLVEEAGRVKDGREVIDKTLVLSEEKGPNISLERYPYSVKLFSAGEAGVREIPLDGSFLLRIPPSLAMEMIQLDPLDFDVYLVGRGTELVRSAYMQDIKDYGLESTALFMLGQCGLFIPGEFNSLKVVWA